MNLSISLTSNLQMKFLSLLLAAILCLFVALEAGDEIDIPLIVTCLNTPSGLAVKVNRNPKIRIEGPRILLLRQQLKGVHLSVDLSGAGEGHIAFTTEETPVRLIQGVKMVRLYPLNIELHR